MGRGVSNPNQHVPQVQEVWLRSNQRILALAMVPMLLLGGVGVGLLLNETPWIRILGGIGLAIAGLLFAGLVLQWLRPRIAYRRGELLFYLQAREPIAVPIEIVEAFFAGQGPAYLSWQHRRWWKG